MSTTVVHPPPLQKKENLTIDKTLTKPKKKSNIINQSFKKKHNSTISKDNKTNERNKTEEMARE